MLEASPYSLGLGYRITRDITENGIIIHIDSFEYLKAAFERLYRGLKNNYFQIDFLGIKPNMKGELNINCELELGENFDNFTEDDFLGVVDYFKNAGNNYALAVAMKSKRFNEYYEKYKLLLE